MNAGMPAPKICADICSKRFACRPCAVPSAHSAGCKVGKDAIRSLSRDLGLPQWNQPAKACLSSRFPFGSPITEEGLRRVERAEEALEDLGFVQLRVRCHEDVARIELDPAGRARLAADPALGSHIADALKQVGFRFVTLDLEGYRSGVFNPES